jgi:hypothetical protein
MKLHMPLLRFFQRQFYKFFDYNSRQDNDLKGKFRVKYVDGRITTKMSYWTAKTYANSFNGTIIDAF